MSRPQLSRPNHPVVGPPQGWREAELSGKPIDHSGDSSNTSPRAWRIPRSSTFPFGSPNHGLGSPTDFSSGFRDRISANPLSLTVPSTDGEHSSHSSWSQSGSSAGAHSTASSADAPPTPASSVSPSDERQNEYTLKKPQSLSEQIWDAMKTCVLPDDVQERKFLPATEMIRIAHGASFRDELGDILVPKEAVVPDRLQLFFALALMRQTKRTLDGLIHEGIRDRDLPFVNRNGVLYCRHSQEADGTTTMRIVRSLKANENGWGRSEIEAFSWTHQYQVTAPQFNVNCPRGDLPTAEIEHRQFEGREALPFTEPPADDGTTTPPYLSGFSMVKKVCIHPAHRNRCLHVKKDAACRTAPFAVKAMDERWTCEMAKNEIATLKRYQVEGQKDRERLIRLLISFEYDRKFYLVFPWADANLEEFWTAKFPNLGDLPRGCGLGRWLAGEMLGLARGLRLIHNPPHSDSSKPCAHGRHGDIKPANILWFSRERDPELVGDGGAPGEAGLPTGMLKICDFGLVEFHTKASVSRVRPSRIEGQTNTYSPPECAPNSGRFISQRYDSWSLGCVLLQFVTWYAQGRAGVETFDNMRQSFEGTYGNGDRYSDLFYSRRRGARKASVKPAVTNQIAMLRKHEERSEFLDDVLSFIEKKLLQVEQEERANTDKLVEAFQGYYNKCLEDSAYCTPCGRREHSVTTPDTASTCQPEPQEKSWIQRVWGFMRKLGGCL